MKKAKQAKGNIWRFLLLAVLFYFILSAFNALVGKEKMAANFRSFYQPITNLVLLQNEVTFAENKGIDAVKFDSRVTVVNSQQVEEGKKEMLRSGKTTMDIVARKFTLNPSRFSGLPTLIVLALIFATPVPTLKKKIIALVNGFVLVKLYVLSKIWIWTMQNTVNYSEAGDKYQSVVDGLKYWMVDEMSLRVIIPFSIWLFVVVKKVDWNSFKPESIKESILSKS